MFGIILVLYKRTKIVQSKRHSTNTNPRKNRTYRNGNDNRRISWISVPKEGIVCMSRLCSVK